MLNENSANSEPGFPTVQSLTSELWESFARCVEQGYTDPGSFHIVSHYAIITLNKCRLVHDRDIANFALVVSRLESEIEELKARLNPTVTQT